MITDQGDFDTTFGERGSDGQPDKAASDDNYLAAQLRCSSCLVS
jgi:hypothetical protein